jgi:hypothetical protein|tara:strand:+ start:5499 stop:6782 length:1284 start_codon:yes stop_codon:yes gene_type:complete
MFKFSDNNVQTSKQRTQSKSRSDTGIVIDVILDETNKSLPKFKEVGQVDGIDASDIHTGKIGGVRVRTLSNSEVQDEDLPIVYPLDATIRTLPVLGEEVQIIRMAGKKFYRQFNIAGTPNVSNEGLVLYRETFGSSDKSGGGGGYGDNSSTGVSQPQGGSTSNQGDYGDYFEADAKIHRLKLFEGDTIIESRFGQSLRFSGYNNDDNKFSPTTIIRNRESDPSRESQGEFSSQKIGGTTLEDVNRDGSTIVMGSRDYQLPFIPGTVDDKGTSDFETTPDTFKDYPSADDLTGDQILISSGRLIFSSKNAEMIFYSKGNYGFISDKGMSIDNALGIDITTGDNINIVTTDNDFNLFAGSGEIHIGDDSNEQLVRGNELVKLLDELLTELASETHPTPAGPSGPPVNAPKYNSIKSKLKNILSPANFTN